MGLQLQPCPPWLAIRMFKILGFASKLSFIIQLKNNHVDFYKPTGCFIAFRVMFANLTTGLFLIHYVQPGSG